MKRKSDNEATPLNGIGPGSVSIRDVLAERDRQRREQQKREIHREVERARVSAYAHGIFEGRRREIVTERTPIVDQADNMIVALVEPSVVHETLVH